MVLTIQTLKAYSSGCTCLFHWMQSSEKHTKADIWNDLQDQHRLLCKEFKDPPTQEDADSKYLAIRAWWLSSRATFEIRLRRLDLLLAFWHFRYCLWRGFMQLVSLRFLSCHPTALSFVWVSNPQLLFCVYQDLSEDELAEMSSCNLRESFHNKWKQQSGNRGLDLYVPTMDDFVRSFMQCVAYYQHLKADRASTSPSKEELKLRVAQRSAKRSANSKSLHKAVAKMPRSKEFCTRTPQLKR